VTMAIVALDSAIAAMDYNLTALTTAYVPRVRYGSVFRVEVAAGTVCPASFNAPTA